MIRNTCTVIIFTLLLSACCEKEGSFLNTIIKNHTAKLAAVAQQEAIISQESSILNANAAAIPIENTLASLLNPKTQVPAAQETEPEAQAVVKTVSVVDVQQKQTANNESNIVVELLDSNELELPKPLEGSNQPQSVAKQKFIDINETSQIQSPIKSKIVEAEAEKAEASTVIEHTFKNKVNNSIEAVTADLDQDSPSIQINEVVDQIIEPPFLSEQKPEDNQSIVASVELGRENITAPEQSLKKDPSETKRLADDNTKKLSELSSLPNEKDNTANESINEQVKTEQSASDNESELDRNARLFELLSKDIKQQDGQPNSKISRQSLELLNDILSN